MFCAPSTGQESFGIVLLEAMAAGRPIIASRIPGYAEVLADGREGLLVPPKDSLALATALTTLLLDPVRRRTMGAHGRTKALAFDWTRVADRVLDFYEETIDRQMEDSVMPAGRVSGAFRRVALRMAPRLAQ